ncbi:WYL domain-containing protein [Candidatus Woesearchaeota archaeon]|jgi:hypothetical protein|nr:WYL domain-containing protein [Candidatus Woesearchaeota archaeon]
MNTKKKVSKLERQQKILDYFYNEDGVDVEATRDIYSGLLNKEFCIKTVENDLIEFEKKGFIRRRDDGAKYLWGRALKDKVVLSGMSSSNLPDEIRAALITVDYHFKDLLPFTKTLEKYIDDAVSNEELISNKLKKWKDKVHISVSTPEFYPPEVSDNNAEEKIYKALLDNNTFNASYDITDFDLSIWGKWQDFEDLKEKCTYHPLGILFKGKFKFLIAKIKVSGVDISDYQQFSLHKFSNVVINTNQVAKTGNDKLQDQCDIDILHYPELVRINDIKPTQERWINLKFWASEGVRQYFEDNIYFELSEDFELKRCRQWPGKLSHIKAPFPENNMVSWGFGTFVACYEGKVRNTKKLRRWLMHIILGIEIIEPKHLRDEFKEIIKASTAWAHNK